MVFFNHATRQMTAKIVYYGPGLCGKTTNLNTIYGKTSQKARGEMVSLNTETDRTLFFDLLPMDVGVIGGFKAKLQLYTVPGQVFYNSTRKLVLKGVDGVVFVTDSQSPMLEANRESLQNLEANLKELGIDLRDIPMVFQWNKRDLKNIVSVEDLERELNPRHLASFQSVAHEGAGVFETLRGITRLALSHIKSHHFNETEAGKAEEVPEIAVSREPEPVLAKSAAVQPLDLSDLPSAGEILGDMAAVETKPLQSKLTPLAAPTKPLVPAVKPAAPKATISPMTVSLAPLSLPKPKSVAAPKANASMMLGDLSQLNLGGSGGALKITLPASLEAGDLEVVVQIRQKDQVIAQGQIKKPAPGKGLVAKLSVELKRS
jgi:signal recognition particle receptor subunit beta